MAVSVSAGMTLDIRFRDGNVAATATGDATAEPAKPKRTASPKKEIPAKDKQGTLL